MWNLTLDVLALAAVLTCAAGLVVLGAVVAPVVFRSGISAAPELMTRIFTRFDRVALACAALAVLVEALRWLRDPAEARATWLRTALTMLFVGTVCVHSLWLSPTIASLHAQGVVRGQGAEGARFDRLHRTSSRNGQVMTLVALSLCAVVLRGRTPRAPELTAR